MPGDNDQTDRTGVGLAGFQVTRDIGIFREQPTSDFGVDAQVEFKHEGQPTGRLVGLQIKTGPSWFDEPTPAGWKFRPKGARHIAYWRRHSLPMYVLLVDLDTETIYWQELREGTLQRGPKGGWFVEIPKAQTLACARVPWETAAEKFAQVAVPDYEDNLRRISPRTARLIRTIAGETIDAAALLAAHLARGRNTPDLVVRTLLTSNPPWLSAGRAGEGLRVLAQYAHSHGLEDTAADALVRAAEQDPPSKYKHTLAAGLMLLDVDRDRARRLLDTARAMPESAEDLRFAIARTILNHPVEDPAPIAVPPALLSRLDANTDDDVVLTFTAGLHERAGDLNKAVGPTERALALDPDCAILMEALARVLTRRAHSTSAQPNDRPRSIALAEQAVDQIHEWSGPTQGVLGTLLHALMAAGQFTAALNRALPPPDGRATLEESRRARVQATAAVAARAIGRDDIAAKVLDAMPEGVDRDVVRLRMDRSSDPGHLRDSWLELLDRLDESRPEDLIFAVMRLSDLGIDKSDRLDILIQRSIIPASRRSIASVFAAAVVDLDANLPALRLLAETDEGAAAKLVELLMDAGRFADAEAAADLAYTRFRSAEFALRRVNALERLDRPEDAEDLVAEVLAIPALDPHNRRLANRGLAAAFIDRACASDSAHSAALWRRAEGHLTACVDSTDLPPEDQDVWQLARVQYKLADPQRAFKTLSDHDPAITENRQARLWFTLATQQPSLPTTAYARMLDLAGQYKDDAQLSGALLTAVGLGTRGVDDAPATPADRRTPIPAELRAAAYAAMQAHVDQHREESPIRILHLPASEDPVAGLTEMVRRDQTPLVELVEMVRQVRLPLGVLATAADRPYAATCVARPLGYYIAAAALEEDAAADELAAEHADGGEVVVDISALLVASELDEYDNFRGKYRRILMPSASHDDIVGSRWHLEVSSASTTTVRYDQDTDSIAASEIDLDEHLGELERFASLERAAASSVSIPNVNLDDLGEAAIDGAAAWLAPIALAKKHRVALWSDDLAQRRLARDFGVEAFGTTTLQQLRTNNHLAHENLDDEALDKVVAARRVEVLKALGKRIVDIPTDPEIVIEQARDESWSQHVALVTVGRPGWWHLAANPFADLRAILHAADEATGNHDLWRYHAMWGAAMLASNEPSRSAALLAAVAILSGDDQIDAHAVVRHLRTADAIANQRKAHHPADFLSEAAAMLANARVLTEPSAVVTRIRAELDEVDPLDLGC